MLLFHRKVEKIRRGKEKTRMERVRAKERIPKERKSKDKSGNKTGKGKGHGDGPKTDGDSKSIICFKCNGTGHYARDCPTKGAKDSGGSGSKKDNGKSKANAGGKPSGGKSKGSGKGV